ncbi:MAG: carboxypeptidase regulatory-like domain-containing protein [Blastocatellia bacterium]
MMNWLSMIFLFVAIVFAQQQKGAITGRVTNADGEPVIAVHVAVLRTREAGQAVVKSGYTDDQGVYRLFGLAPGSYIVVANGSGQNRLTRDSAYEGEGPTFHPAATTRDAATEVRLASGAELAGIDIRYRGGSGHTISGKVMGGPARLRSTLVSVALEDLATGANVKTLSLGGNEPFAFEQVPDGDYRLVAELRGDDETPTLASPFRDVRLRGGDAGGIELRLAALASIAGRVELDPAAVTCDRKSSLDFELVLLDVVRADRAPAQSPGYVTAGHAPDEKGAFTIRDLDPGRYRIEARLPSEHFYVKSIQAPVPVVIRNAGKSSLRYISRDVIALQSGENQTGVVVTLARGAAGLRGKVVAASEGTSSPKRFHVHLVPAEAVAADDALRYAETTADANGAFSFDNLSPGRYWLLARPVAEERAKDGNAWDNVERAKLRREAEAAKNEIELQPCQREAFGVRGP